MHRSEIYYVDTGESSGICSGQHTASSFPVERRKSDSYILTTGEVKDDDGSDVAAVFITRSEAKPISKLFRLKSSEDTDEDAIDFAVDASEQKVHYGSGIIDTCATESENKTAKKLLRLQSSKDIDGDIDFSVGSNSPVNDAPAPKPREFRIESSSKYPFGQSLKSKEKISPYLRPFTKQSVADLEARTAAVIRDYGFLPRRNATVADGSILPHQYEPFPSSKYGSPLEEMDHFIFHKVC